MCVCMSLYMYILYIYIYISTCDAAGFLKATPLGSGVPFREGAQLAPLCCAGTGPDANQAAWRHAPGQRGVGAPS